VGPIIANALNKWPQPWYSDSPRLGLVARFDIARLGAFRLGYLGIQPPDDGPNTGFAEWQDGDDFPAVSEEWTEGDDFK